MNIFSELKIGDKLEIDLISDDSFNIKSIASQLIDIEKNTLIISNPILNGTTVSLKLGQQVNVFYFRGEKGIFCFTGEVVYKENKEFDSYGIKPLSEPEKIQRRFYYRLSYSSKAVIRDLNETTGVECFIRDISGGGVKLACKKEFAKGKIVECIIHLDETQKIAVSGKIVRVDAKPFEKEYELSIHFFNVSDEIINIIIGFIFKKQRELRKKGLK